MRLRLIAAGISSFALFLVPAAGLAWHATQVAAAADPGAPSGCPVLDGTACPASAGVELAHLAVAADQGCPFSTEQLIEKAQRCSDEATAGLARKAAEGDDEARVELIQRIKTLLSIDPGPVDPANLA